MISKKERLIDVATGSIADRLTMEDSLQERVVNIDVVPGTVGVTFLNKDGSYFIEVWSNSKEDESIIYTNSAMNKDLYEVYQV